VGGGVSRVLRRIWHRTGTFRETLRLALDTLRANKLRSLLTLVGVILAVATLVVVMSVVHGLNRYIAERLANFGSNVFVVNKMGIVTGFVEFIKRQRRPPILYDDYLFLSENMREAEQVSAADDALVSVRHGNEVLEDVVLLGTTPNFLEVRGWGLENGRFFTETDHHHRTPVCIPGADVVERFFPHTDPVGKVLRVGSQTCEVVGTIKRLGTVLGQSRDNLILMPLGTYMKGWFRPGESLFLLVQARSPERMQAAQDEARLLLRARRQVRWQDEDNFGIIAPDAITGLWERLTGSLFAIALGLTSVFLVVGGIVIMNIMLASVVERTREIGIRKALGARRRHILAQFLVESATLSAVGGLLGIFLAFGLGRLFSLATELPVSTPVYAIFLALALATSVGLFFGIYPAMRAARLDPVEAMRAET
jgi:putative ABC transport system permease protein